MAVPQGPGQTGGKRASSPEIGFLQGRLSPQINGKIQAFPWLHWREEFSLAADHGFHLMEWTLDQDRLYENPLMMESGHREIRRLCDEYEVRIKSLTGDCFMQAPFYKARGQWRDRLVDDLTRILENSASLGLDVVVMPLVDRGSLENSQQQEDLLRGLEKVVDILKAGQLSIVFESDFPPSRLAQFIGGLDEKLFGINYDIGNSAALGYRPKEELAAYGARILNVHVKDRCRGGGTVPLGKGDADLPGTLRTLQAMGYAGPYILQTARAEDGDHVGALCKYRDMVNAWLNVA